MRWPCPFENVRILLRNTEHKTYFIVSYMNTNVNL